MFEEIYPKKVKFLSYFFFSKWDLGVFVPPSPETLHTQHLA